MTKEELRARTKAFALRVIKLVDALPRRSSGQAIGNQLVRSGTAFGANYRAACRARSDAEFVAKLGVVVEESDESGYWLELIIEGALLKSKRVQPLLDESNELLAIFSSAHSTLRHKMPVKRHTRRRTSRLVPPRTKSRNPGIPKSRNP